MSNVKHGALSQKIGDIYHYYIAIQVLLENNSWNKCSIETYGDITIFDENDKQIYNIEVKHHNEKKELKIYEEEFQKTLFNWFNIKDQFEKETKLILMTSSIISDKNALEHWNKFDSNKKYKVLQENQKKNVTTYYSNVSKYLHPILKDTIQLKEVLEKVYIEHSLPNILKIRENIKTLGYFRIFGEHDNKKETAIDILYALIGKGLKDKKTWEVTKVEFNQKLKEVTSLVQEKIVRTNNDIDKNSLEPKQYKNKQFIKKLENIELKEDVQQQAIANYAKSLIEIEERSKLSESLEFNERLDGYSEDLINLVNETKLEYEYRRDMRDVEKSQQSYFQIMRSTKVPFMSEEFDDRTTFFQKGYLHILADDEDKPKQVCWSLKAEDLK